MWAGSFKIINKFILHETNIILTKNYKKVLKFLSIKLHKNSLIKCDFNLGTLSVGLS